MGLRTEVCKQIKELNPDQITNLFECYAEHNNISISRYFKNNMGGVIEAFGDNLTKYLSTNGIEKIYPNTPETEEPILSFCIDKCHDGHSYIIDFEDEPYVMMGSMRHTNDIATWLMNDGKNMRGFDHLFHDLDNLWLKRLNGKQEIRNAFINGDFGDINDYPTEPTINNFKEVHEYAIAWSDWINGITKELFKRKIIKRIKNTDDVFVLKNH